MMEISSQFRLTTDSLRGFLNPARSFPGTKTHRTFLAGLYTACAKLDTSCWLSCIGTCNRINDVKHVSKQINIELTNIQEWLNINKLSLNVRKTKYMIFHHYQRNITNISPTLNINCEPIERVTEFNFLGLTIDEHLSWKPHMQKISNKIARTLGIMCRLKSFLPTDIRRILYNSLILPHLQYSVLSWGFKMGRLDKLQKRANRIISNSRYTIPTPILFSRSFIY